jgi:hypothetical protein
MRLPLLLVFCLLALPAFARPVSFPDGWMFMQMNDHSEHSLMLSYSPTAKYAVGARSDYMQEYKYWLNTATYNRLLKRWNEKDSQANLFLQTGIGAATKEGITEPAGFLGLEADWETQRLYLSYENSALAAGSIEESFTHKARFGVAPYVGGYDDIHTWFMVQVEHHPYSTDKVVVTPLVRFFTTQFLTEVGISDRADVMLNVTLQF